MADEGQAPCSPPPPPPVLEAPLHSEPESGSFNSLAGSYSPAQPLITSGREVSGTASHVMQQSGGTLNDESMCAEQCGCAGTVQWTGAAPVMAAAPRDMQGDRTVSIDHVRFTLFLTFQWINK